MDSDFSSALVRHFGNLTGKPADMQEDIKHQVQDLLVDICEWTPLTSDKVELKNGAVQWSVSKRGSQNVKNARVAAETSLLQAAVKQNAWSRDSAGQDTLPPKRAASSIRKMVGTTSTNQFTAKDQQFPFWFSRFNVCVREQYLDYGHTLKTKTLNL